MDRPHDESGNEEVWFFDEPAEPEEPDESAAQPDEPVEPAPEPASTEPRVGLRDRLRGWDDLHRATSFVPDSETVVLDVRRHASLLALPVLRTGAAFLVLISGAGLLTLVLFAVLTALWIQGRSRPSLRLTGLVTGGAVLALLLVNAALGPVLGVLLLLGWLCEDLADWWSDRLVVSDRRIYRRHGVLTRHSPSISLMAIAYLDAAVPPVGRLLHYGTLRLDSVAQRDAPLSRFDLIPDVVEVSHEILRLRTQAMPTYPPQIY